MNSYIKTYIQTYIISFLNIQLFITLISLPILVAWGIPISLLSIVGNLLFAPFLTAHIFIASLLFACTFCNYQCQPLFWLLTTLTRAWSYLMCYFPQHGSIGFAQPPAIFFAILPFITAAILHYRPYNAEKKVVAYSVVLSLLIMGSYIHQKNQSGIHRIGCFNGHVSLITTSRATILIDPGYIGQRISAPSWIEYTLIPEMIKMLGRTHIDYVICLQPNICTYRALETLCYIMPPHKIYIAPWDAPATHAIWHTKEQFLSAAQQRNVAVFDIAHKSTHNKALSNEGVFFEVSSDKAIHKNGISITQCTIRSIIDNKSFSFYAAGKSREKNSPKKRLSTV